jgi:hypothetical protein
MVLVRFNLMKTGDLVRVETFSGEKVLREVVAVEGDTVYICTKEEKLSAQKENREPVCAGFNRRYVDPVMTGRSYHHSVSNA